MGGRSGQSINSGDFRSKVSILANQTASESISIHKGDISGYERSVYIDFDGINRRDGLTKSTAKLKAELGGYISTEKIYNTENVIIPKEVRYHIQELGKKKVDDLINQNKTQKISISDIKISQEFVFENPLMKAILSKKDKVVLFKHNGNYYLNDGNHRVAAAKLKGKKSVNAVIENVE